MLTSVEQGSATRLYLKISAITDEIGPVLKQGFNENQRYKFLREEDVINAVRPAMVKHGVICVPEVLEESISTIQQRNGTATLCRLRVQFTFVDIETGGMLEVVTSGHGVDQGDKAANKAMTAALKYALRQLFMISEGGDDAEADESTDRLYEEREPNQVVISASNVPGAGRGGRNTYPNQVQIDELRRLAREKGMTVTQMGVFIKVITGDEVDVSDPATAGMELTNYLATAPSKTVEALIRGLLTGEKADANPSFDLLPPEEPVDDDLPDLPA